MDYYKILGISRGCSKEDIRKAYLKMALLNHPDRHLENKEYYTKKFKEIGEAYEILYKDNTKNIDIDPYEIFRNIIPKNIKINPNTLNMISEVYKKFIDNNYNFNVNLFFELIQLVNNPNFKNKINEYFDNSLSIKLIDKKAETLIINEIIDLSDQYNSNNYTIKINLHKRSKSRFPKLINYNKEFQINLLNQVTIIPNQGNYNLKDRYQGDIEINILDKPHKLFSRYKDFDLVYNLFISKENFFSEIYHTIPHFKKNLYIFIDLPYKNSIYKIKDFGMIDYSDNYTGDLYINLKVDINMEKSNRYFKEYIIPEAVDIFI